MLVTRPRCDDACALLSSRNQLIAFMCACASAPRLSEHAICALICSSLSNKYQPIDRFEMERGQMPNNKMARSMAFYSII